MTVSVLLKKIRCVGKFGFKFVHLAVFLFISGIAHAQPISLTDDTGQTLQFTQPVQRIVALSPAITENLFAIGLGERIVGVSSHSDYPHPAKKIPVVSDYQSIDLEAILKLKPDVIVAWHGGQSPAQLRILQQLSIPIFYQKINTLADIPTSLMRLSHMAGNQSTAAPISAHAYGRIPLIAQAPTPILSAFYQVWGQPLMTVNRQSWVSDALNRCGAHNMFSDLPTSAPMVNMEDVLKRNPALIITATAHAQPDHTLDMWHNWHEISALKHQGLLFADADLMNRATLRTLVASEHICAQIAHVRARMGS